MSVERRTIDVAALIERRSFDAFSWRLIVISWLITVFDGFDLSIAAFAAPYMREELHLSTSQLANVFSAGLAGMTLGGLVFSYFADRIGRRPVVILTAFAFGILTCATALAPNYPILLLLRLLDGFAIGGMVPIAWALNVEFVPRRLRATVVTIIMVGYSCGTSGAGPITVWLQPMGGWRGLFVFGGVGSIVASVLLLVWLPESIRLLVTRGRAPERVARLVNRLDPAIGARADDIFVLGDEAEAPRKVALRELFHGGLRFTTPLLWLSFFASSIAVYFLNGFGPTVLEAMGFARRTAALATAFGGIMGSVAAIAMMRFTDRFGPRTVAFYPVLVLPLLLLVGLASLAHTPLLILAMLVLMLIGGMQLVLVSIVGMLYPTAVRGSGSGWASSVGKVGGVFGPILGGMVLSSGLPAVRSYLFLAVCPAIVFACAIPIAILYRRAHRGIA